MTISELNHISTVKSLLASADLPIEDLDVPPLNGERLFFGVNTDIGIAGLVGLEIFDASALLRSLVVRPGFRGKSVGRSLVSHVESVARRKGVANLYLLTTSAESYFAASGYLKTSREHAPHSIQNTAEYSSLCPGDAAFMSKRLT